MNTVFPETPGLSGAFLQGWRRRPGSAVNDTNNQEVYTVIVKHAFVVTPDTDPAIGTLVGDAGGPEVFDVDQTTNLLRNADFADQGLHWALPANGTVVFGDGSVDITSTSGAEALRQTIAFDADLHDRRIAITATLAAQNTPAAPQLRIEVGGDTTDSDAGLVIDPEAVLSTSYVIPAGTAETDLIAHFPTLAVNGEPLSYSDLAVQYLRFESDFVPFKPEADIIVAPASGSAPTEVRVNGTLRFDQPAATALLNGLGWEPKIDSPRESEAGDMGDPNKPQAFPNDFANSYFNAARRGAKQPVAQDYLQPGDRITLRRKNDSDYGFSLPEAFPELTHKWFTGQGKDDPCLWRSRPVPLNLDTLVIEPDRDRAYAVWRACWALDDALGGQGPIDPGANREVLVTLQGAA